MKAINLNSRPYYVTGKTVWDNGREITWDDYKREPIVCPQVQRYGSYTITYLTCEMLKAAQHEVEDARAEAHADEQLKNLENPPQN